MYGNKVLPKGIHQWTLRIEKNDKLGFLNWVILTGLITNDKKI